MFRQYDAIADLLLPTELTPSERSTGRETAREEEPQPSLNFGE
jgi:hypothetical protein